MNGRSGKRGACPSGEVIEITAESGGCSRGSSNSGFQLKTLLALPHYGQHSVKKYTKPHLPKHGLTSVHRKVDDQMEMQPKVLPTLSVAPHGAKNSTGVKKKTHQVWRLVLLTLSLQNTRSNYIAGNTVKKKIDRTLNFKYRPLYYRH